MKHRVQVGIAALVLAVVAGGALAHAQPAAVVNIGFAFMAGGKSMPAGKYDIQVTSGGPVLLRGPSSQVLMPVMTRLGRRDNDREPELVFDNVGGALHLSEVWFPGSDGYLLLGTKEQHDHTVLGGPKGKK
jgi:hypothetical protein